MLKADLHLHTNEDRYESLNYDAKKLIRHAAKLDFEVLSITNHIHFSWSDNWDSYAKKRGILLIPGVELRLEGKDVLVYNINANDIKKIKKIKDLYALKKRKPSSLIIAAHPYFIQKCCLNHRFIEHLDLWDAVEYAHFYNRFLNLNNKSERISKDLGIPMVGSSDAHNLAQVNNTYTLIDSKKDINSVINAIKKGKVVVESKPLSMLKFSYILYSSLKVAMTSTYKETYKEED